MNEHEIMAHLKKLQKLAAPDHAVLRAKNMVMATVRRNLASRLVVAERSPFIKRLIPGYKFKYMPILAIILAVVLGGGGTVAAAQNDLPGDALFGVKLATERVQEALTLSDEKKVEVKAKFATRRAEELEKLTERTPEQAIADEAVAEAMARFEAHVRGAEQALAQLPPQAVLRVAGRLASVLTEHQERLERVREKLSTRGKGDVDDAVEVTLEVEASVTEDEEEAAEKSPSEIGLRERAEGKIGAATNKLDEVRRKITRLSEESERERGEVRRDLGEKRAEAARVHAEAVAQGAKVTVAVPALPELPTVNTSAAQAKFQEAEAALADARAKFEAGAYADAFVRAGDAIRLAIDAKLLLKRSERALEQVIERIEEETEDALEAAKDAAEQVVERVKEAAKETAEREREAVENAAEDAERAREALERGRAQEAEAQRDAIAPDTRPAQTRPSAVPATEEMSD